MAAILEMCQYKDVAIVVMVTVVYAHNKQYASMHERHFAHTKIFFPSKCFLRIKRFFLLMHVLLCHYFHCYVLEVQLCTGVIKTLIILSQGCYSGWLGVKWNVLSQSVNRQS